MATVSCKNVFDICFGREEEEGIYPVGFNACLYNPLSGGLQGFLKQFLKCYKYSNKKNYTKKYSLHMREYIC